MGVFLFFIIMKKQNILILLLLILLIIISIYVGISNRESSLSKVSYEFAVSDISLIDKIEFENNSQNKLHLLKKHSQWLVNQSFNARNEAIVFLLRMLTTMEMKSPVSIDNQEIVALEIKKNGVKISIFSNENILKQFYVGEYIKNQGGTMMILADANIPYIVNIPGVATNIAELFIIKESFWRDRAMINYQISEIQSISINNYKNENQSFKIQKINNNYSFILLNNKVIKINKEKIEQYLSNLQNSKHDGIDTSLTKIELDSILKSKPEYLLQVTDKQGITTSIKTFLFPVKNNKENKFDLNKLLIQINTDTELFVSQYVIFDILLVDADYFLK